MEIKLDSSQATRASSSTEIPDSANSADGGWQVKLAELGDRERGQQGGLGGVSDGASTERKQLPIRIKFLLGIGESVQGINVMICGYYLNSFLLETACLDPMYVGIMQATTGAFDAINDPVIGLLSDRTRSRWGRRRPWLLFGAPLLAISYFGLWNALPASVPQFWKFMYVLLMYMGVSAGVTSIQVQIGALVPELTDDYDERTSVSGWRLGIANLLGLGAALIHSQIIRVVSGESPLGQKEGFRVSAAVFAVVLCSCAWITFAGIRERFDTREESRKSMRILQELRTVLTNKGFLCVSGAYLCGPTAVVLLQSNLLMFCKYWLHDADIIMRIMICVQGMGLLMVPFWVWVTSRLDKGRAYLIGGSILVVAFSSIYFVRTEAAALGLSFLISTCLPVPYLIPYSMLPDVIDEDELRTGKRREGTAAEAPGNCRGAPPAMDGSSPRLSVRILAKVRREIDSFLDPSVLSLVHHEDQAKDRSTAGESAAFPGVEGSFDGASPCAGLKTECHPELLALRCKSEDLQSKLEDTKCEMRAQRAEWERRAGRDAAALAKAAREREGLERDARGKKRRLSEVEGKLAEAERQNEASATARKQQLDLHSAERQQLQAEVSRLKQELVAARAGAAQAASAAADAAAPAVGAEALRQRTEELEHETRSLRLALQQAQPELDIGAQLRKRHAEYEEELKSAREVREELKESRGKVLALEREAAGLRAALDARDAALREAQEAVRGASLAKRDLAAFAATARVVIEESALADGCGEAGAAEVPGDAEAPPATPLELGLAWGRFQTAVRSLRQRSAEQQQRLDQATQQEQGAQVELSRLRGDLAIAQARAEELQVSARRAQDDCATQAARVSVLRDAITRGVGIVTEDSESLRPELEDARKHAVGLEEVIKAKERALSQVTQELEALRKDSLGLADARARAVRLEQLNSELWSSNRSLQRQQERLSAQGSFGAPATGSAGELLCREPVPTGDAEHHADTLELERFRKATRRYVQEFREGLYGLLGWKVEMRADGGAMQWHLTSRFREERSLIFQLRPGEAGRPAQFDLLGTPWGEELQGDRRAMAFLEVYGSIPGFLAHVTANLLTSAPE